jgi:PAS domain S-box-containing protein
VNSSPNADHDEVGRAHPGSIGSTWVPSQGTEHPQATEHRDLNDDSGHPWDRWLAWLLENGPQPFAVIDLERRIIKANRAFSDLVGYSREELLGMSIFELTAPHSLEVTHRSHAEILASGKNERVLKCYRRKDGSVVPVELMIDVFRDDAGQPQGLYAFITDISDRVKAEEALRVSEQRYRQLYDEAPVGYHEIDCETRIMSINRKACELLGYAPEELLGRSVLELIPQAARNDAGRVLREKLAGTRPLVAYQEVLVRSDGTHVPVEIQEREHRDERGGIAGLRSVLQDISERIASEAALVEVERRTRALFDGIQDAVFVHDQQGQILDANPAACRQLGYSRDELLSMTTGQIDAPEFAAGFEQRLRQQLEQGRLTCEGRHRTKSGREIPVEVTTSTIHFDSQVAVLAVLRDITERKALERTRRDFAEAQMRNAQEMELKNQALSDSEARYRQLAEGSLDAIIVADEDARITLFNPAAEKIFGYEAGDIVGRPLVKLIPRILEAPEPPEAATPGVAFADDAGGSNPAAPTAPSPVDRAADDGVPGGRPLALSPIVGRTVELIGRKRDGSDFPLEISLSLVELNGRPQYIGSIRDQTERQKMRAMLALTDKLASIGLLSAWVAHEINNPLAYVLNNLVVLERDFKGMLELVNLYETTTASLVQSDPQAVRRIAELVDAIDWIYIRDNLDRLFERTRAGVKRVASIVEKMRVLARSSTPQWETVSLADLLESALEIMRGRLHHLRVDVSVQIQSLPAIECVPDQISQVLLNLLINALQAIESTGRQEGGRIDVEGRTIGPWVSISVRDNGCGIDPRHREKLFDPFFTTKPVGEGTGLGLAISHGIVSGHGGRIEIESRPGEGSCFRVLLPTHHSGSGPPAEANPSFSSPRPA